MKKEKTILSTLKSNGSQHDYGMQDAITKMVDVRTNSYDAVVTSPPPAISYDYTGLLAREALRIAPVMVVNYGTKPSEAGRMGGFISALNVAGHIQSHIIWAKHISMDDQSFGHFRPIISRRYLNGVHESIFIVSRDGHFKLDRLAVGVPYTDQNNIKRFKGAAAGKRCRGNLWFMPYETQHGGVDNPPSYPQGLEDMMLAVVGNPTKVFDPFAYRRGNLTITDEFAA